MLRFHSNEKKSFSATMEAFALETEAALAQRWQEINQEWDSIDEEWQTLRERMTQVGITTPLDSKKGIDKLNVGGSLVSFRRSVLSTEAGGKQQQQPSTWALENLFEAEWDKRVPGDSDGRIVLDESPTCVKHLVHGLLTRSSLAEDTAAREGEVACDDKLDLLDYTARVLGLSGRLVPVLMSIIGGTSISEPHQAPN
ncbi:conserved unknown protein [Ectocarpus siliculosus]|uniref:Uncharacterized protein n=1 Tax=Ectocarpus siliculosus TaxID=2880 RepID=D7FIX9_ECTSI|nr:conserved unknown protein [Ectocarpus siliculosus]|eukprot:CBJ28927.1 conserved unknown protein [Ectocarpus siliculosus]